MRTLSVKISFPENRQLNTFVNMLAWMEWCGNAGHCTDFLVRLDGDGSARPKFIFENDEMQESYEQLRGEMWDTFKTTPQYKDDIDLHFFIS